MTRKITRALANIAYGLEDCLYLGSLDALRDWGHAKDYVRMQWLMLQQEVAEDYVVATGVQLSVRDFVKMAASQIGVTLEFLGSGASEVGVVASIDTVLFDELELTHIKSGMEIVKVDPRYYRPAEVQSLLGDPSKAKAQLGWQPEITIEQMCEEMMINDLKFARRNSLLKTHGYE